MPGRIVGGPTNRASGAADVGVIVIVQRQPTGALNAVAGLSVGVHRVYQGGGCPGAAILQSCRQRLGTDGAVESGIGDESRHVLGRFDERHTREVVAIGKVAHYATVTEYGFDHASHYRYHQDDCVETAAKWLAERKSDRPLCLLVGTALGRLWLMP